MIEFVVPFVFIELHMQLLLVYRTNNYWLCFYKHPAVEKPHPIYSLACSLRRASPTATENSGPTCFKISSKNAGASVFANGSPRTTSVSSFSFANGNSPLRTDPPPVKTTRLMFLLYFRS